MTTLVYSRADNIVAIDSRMTSTYIMTDAAEKWVYDGDELYFIVGTVSDVDEMLNLINSGSVVVSEELDIDVLLVRVTDVPTMFGICDGLLFSEPLHAAEFKSYGSGSHFALAALDLGCTPKQAIEQAMKRDMYTGGKVVQYDLTKQRFKK